MEQALAVISDYQVMHRCCIKAALATHWISDVGDSKDFEDLCVWKHREKCYFKSEVESCRKITEFSP